MSAINRAAKAPIRTDPIKTMKNYPIDTKTSQAKCSSEAISEKALYNTTATASLNMLSPKMSENRVTSALSSLKIDRTATGSVAEISAPKAQLSLSEKKGVR